MLDEPISMTRSWSSIREFYESLVVHGLRFDAMIELIRKIEASSYSTGVFAWTSMHTLCVVQTAVFHPYDGPVLYITPALDGDLEFRYFANRWQRAEWCRTAREGAGFELLMNFMDQLRWIPRINFPPP